jgi:hypothetical protein
MSTGQNIVGKLAIELGMSDEQFRQSLAHSETMAKQAASRMQQTVNQGTQAMGERRSFTGFALNVSRAVDDAQYGFRGIVNNMEMIGMEAGRAFGMSTKAAMGFGAAMTLTAVAINNALPALEKMTDLRTDYEKLATSPIAFANSIMLATRSIATMQKEAATLLSNDATNGFGAFLQRQINDLTKWSDRVSGAQGTFSRFAKTLGIAQSFDQQTALNRDAGQAANRLMIKTGIENVEATQNKSYFDKGLNLLGESRIANRRDMTVDPDIKEVFAKATKGQLEQVKVDFTKAMMNRGMNADQAENAAIRYIGEASEGIKASAKSLETITNSFNITKPLEEFRAKRLLNPQFNEYQDAVGKQSDLINRRDSLLNQMKRSEILGTADVFGANLNAGMKSEELKQLEEINKGIQELKPMTGLG